MKKFTFAIVALFMATGAFAQNYNWGIKAGLNLAKLTTQDGNGETRSRTGLHIGIFREFDLSNRLSIQPELVYSMQGSSTKIGSTTYKDKFDYINLPVMLKIYVYRRSLSADAGLQFGYMVSAKGKVSGTGGSSTTNVYDRIDNKFDVAVGLGVSYKFLERFDAGLRFNIGTIKLVDNRDLLNSVFQLGMGVRF